jgi:4-hydroxy-L-threonine phosphate dehydrogenase PdxA
VRVSTVAPIIGHPNGIGLKIAVKAAARLSRGGRSNMVSVGDELCDKDIVLKVFDDREPVAGFLQFLSVEALSHQSFGPGTPVAASERVTVDYIPMKLLAGRNSAALLIRAGLLFSSVGRGSAFDNARHGDADPEAMFRSLRLIGGASCFGAAAAP